jgi:hypothetical protein
MLHSIDRPFVRIGAEVRVRGAKTVTQADRNAFRSNSGFRIGVERGKGGEYFDIAAAPGEVDVSVVECRPDVRHLVLHVRHMRTDQADKFLCGLDERHWFAAAVPGAGVSSVDTARLALMPQEVRAELERLRVPRHDWFERRTRAFVRQGEWFFVPTRLELAPTRRNEPLVRSGGAKPHTLEFAHRASGTQVHVCAQYPAGLTTVEHKKLLAERPEAKRWRWRSMYREPVLYARGRVSHPDHSTISLGAIWHRVYVNEEHRAPARQYLTFLD